MPDHREYSISTPIGKFTGLQFLDPVSQEAQNIRFAKIPYSQKVDGKNRWLKPVPLPKDYDYSSQSYTELGEEAPQPVVLNENLKRLMPQSGHGDENITYLNIWVPTEPKPEGGFPVLVYIHGGWLQYGNPSEFENPRNLQHGNALRKYIIVTPGYRLNVLGFLSSLELLKLNPGNSNLGFWDQRLAIEWTYENIEHFGGNPEKITVGGLSAGSYSTFFQLAYELYHGGSVKQIIKQVVHFSNAILVQPKSIEEVDEQYHELLEKLNIDNSLSTEEKLEKLQAVDSKVLMETLPTMKFHTFRAATDETFVSSTLLKDLTSGKFSELIKSVKPNLRIVIGEVPNEPYLYSVLDTPKTKEELAIQLENYYPHKAVSELLKVYPQVPSDLSQEEAHAKYKELFGRIVADGQVYASSRGYIKNLVDHGFPKENLFRYRAAFRPKYVDEILEPAFGVIHGLDLKVWFPQSSVTKSEKAQIETFIHPFNEIIGFVENKHVNWGTTAETEYRYFAPSGELKIVTDESWDWGTTVANAAYRALLS